LVGANSNRRQKNKTVRRRRAAAAIARQGDPKGEAEDRKIRPGDLRKRRKPIWRAMARIEHSDKL
jgi:hypothetical protein